MRQPIVSAKSSQHPDLFWRSLHYYNLYRLIIAGVFVAAFYLYESPPFFSTQFPTQFFFYSVGYAAACGLSILTISTRWPRFNLQMAFQVSTDILFFTLLMSISEGVRGGLGLLLLISLAVAGLISRGRLAIFYASLASIAVLVEHTYDVLVQGASSSDFFHAGLLSMGFFATAWLAHILAKNTLASEKLAEQRGVDLANLAQVNQLVIQDMHDGVIVVDGEGKIRQRNSQVDRLLGFPSLGGPLVELQLSDYSPALAERFRRWRADPTVQFDALRVPTTNKQVRARFVPVDKDHARGALIFIEDLSQIQTQAQQLKLAALGRLTANIAHEIRNPLSAISHATQLLQEEQQQDKTQTRLLQIIGDNTRRLDRMVQDVLQLNRRDRAQLEKIASQPFLKNFVEEFCQAEKIPLESFSIEIDTNAALYFDRAHLHQIIWNLCRNAWRHGKKTTGSIRLCITPAIFENIVQLDVIDDGPGVDEALQSQLFEPFFTTESQGTGLGLYIAKEVCEANGATLDYIEVAPGGQFRICCKGESS